MDNSLTDQDLRRRLEACGFDPGPLTEVSRPYWNRKLAEGERSQKSPSPARHAMRRQHPVRAGLKFPDEEDEVDGARSKDAAVPSDSSGDESSDEEEASEAKRREAEDLQRKVAVSKVRVAGARVLDGVYKAHLKGRRPHFLLRYSQHILVGVLLAVAAVFLLQSINYDIMRRSPDARDSFIWCTAGEFCKRRTVERITNALKLSCKITSVADEVAGALACKTSDVDGVSSVMLKEIAASMGVEGVGAKLMLDDALQLLMHNPHWKIAVLSSKFIKLEPEDDVSRLGSAHVVSTNPMKPFQCRLLKAAHSAATQALLLAFLGFLIVMVFVAIRFYVRRQEESRQHVFKMVDRILSHVHGVYQRSLNDEYTSPAVPISHVRDALLPPAKRKALSPVWEEAVTWINGQESRIRTETRRISGEDFVVWRWIPIASYAKAGEETRTEADGAGRAPAADSAPGSPGSLSPGQKLLEREKQWGGHVLEHYSGESFRQQVLPLADQPSCCVKLRNLYSVQPRPLAVEFEELEAAVLHKLTQHGGVLHCFLDRWTDEGALYAKLNSADAATSVISALHGTWYKSRLVKAEYVSLTEYHRLFPSSKRATKLLFPS